MPVLVLDGHSRAALETMQSLGRAGVEVDIAAESDSVLAMHSRYATRRLVQPGSTDKEGFASWLRQQDWMRSYELIVPATEASLLCLRALDEHDPLRVKAVLPSNEALDIALDKQATCRLARDLGIPVPGSRLISTKDEIGESEQFPVVLKPVRSKVVMNGELRTLAVAIVRTEEQRREQLRRWLPFTPVLQQQYVAGRGVGIEFLFDHGKPLWHFAHERIHEFPLSGGASSYRRCIMPPGHMLLHAQRLMSALRWHGVAMVEFKMDSDGQLWLMEINPRMWGSLALPIDAGVDFPFGLLQVARGKAPGPQPACKIGYCTRDLATDAEWFKANLRADRSNPLLMTRPRLLSFAGLLRPLTGKESWDFFDWRDLGVTRHVLATTLKEQLAPLNRKIAAWKRERDWMRRHKKVLKSIATGKVKRMVFVCLGNICRSPFAAALAKQSIAAVEIDSAGFYPREGRSTPEKMLRITRQFGVDLSAHRSTRLSARLLDQCDLVLVMDRENMVQLEREFPESVQKATFLGLFLPKPSVVIDDPYAADATATQQICEQIVSGVEALAERIARGCASAAHEVSIGSMKADAH
ncbi:MAG TPA: ATP-grasp domain-containing protein [Candidatus Angelobacter sp.]|jgi:protein-tyrosine-phosphatase/predicted ATP-grasp superfamily ATP-dependent carboligase|nr:ATP-grasp domain-containing protein [Candidatus Angelobacter sp.]